MKILRYNADPIEIDTNEVVSVIAQSNSTLCVYTKERFYVGYALKK